MSEVQVIPNVHADARKFGSCEVCGAVAFVSFWSPEARRLFQDIVSVCKEKVKIRMTDRTKKVEVENG